MNEYFSKLQLFILTMLLLIGVEGYAQQPIVLDDNRCEYVVGHDYWRISKDSLTNVQIEDLVKSGRFNLKMIDYEQNPDWNVASFWFKSRVFNSSSIDLWVFEVPDPHIDEVEFFFQNEEGRIEQIKKTLQEKNRSTLPHKNFSHVFQLKKGEEGVIYLRLRSGRSYGTVFKIRSLSKFTEYSLNEYVLLGIYYGVLLLIILNNLFIYISLKRKIYLLYIGYVILLGLRSLSDDGLGSQYIWSAYPGLSEIISAVVPIALLVIFLFYSHDFLETKKRATIRYIVLNSIVLVYGFYYGLELVFGKNQYSTLIYTLPFICIYFNSIITYRDGYKPARYFVLAYSVLVLSFVVNYFKSIGAFSEDSFLFVILVYSLNIGFLIEVIILSFAMGDKFKALESERNLANVKMLIEAQRNEELSQKVNRELEQKVRERTLELEESNELLNETTLKMIEQSELVNQMNLKLDLANRKLKKESKKIIEDRIHLKGIGFDDFVSIYPDDRSCYKFLSNQKWRDGYTCPKCGNKKYSPGNGPFARKCSKCTYNESVKVNTIFQGLRFETVKAFYLVFLVIDTRGEISSYELADKLELRQKTCWAFKKKLIDHIKKNKISYDDCKSTGWAELVVI